MKRPWTGPRRPALQPAPAYDDVLSCRRLARPYLPPAAFRSGARLRRGAVVSVATLSGLGAEERALVAALRGELPPDGPLDWTRVDGLARQHSIVPLLHRAWKESPTGTPPDMLAGFLQERRRIAFLGQIGLQERDRALTVLRDAGIACLVLKGAALARAWYGDLSLRGFLDIDLLTSEGDADRAQAALMDSKYVPVEPAEATAYHDMPLQRLGIPFAVEIHRGLTALPVRRQPTFEELLPRSISLTGPDSHVRTLGPEDTLLHLCIHQLQHQVQEGGWQLRHLYDIRQHISTFPIDWELFGALGAASGTRRACGISLGLTALILGTEIPGPYADVEAAAPLAAHSVGPPVGEHWLGRFMVALSRRDYGAMRFILRRTMAADRSRNSALRPLRLFRPAWRVSRMTVRDPRRMQTQLRDWFVRQEHRDSDTILLQEVLTHDH